jgi:Rha family phage regulatory protein
MQNLESNTKNTPIVTIVGRRAITTSKDVADYFGKRHDHVLRDIKELIADLPVEHLPNFGETVIERENPSGGAPIKSPAYEITRDGFTLLAMGFTGKKALASFHLAAALPVKPMHKKVKPSRVMR